MPYNRKKNVLSVSLNKTFVTFVCSGDAVKVDFISMRASAEYTDICTVQRLTTISSKNAIPGLLNWTTEWHWYWKDVDGKWTEYGKQVSIIYLFVYLFIYLFVCLFVCLFTYLFVYLFTYLFI